MLRGTGKIYTYLNQDSYESKIQITAHIHDDEVNVSHNLCRATKKIKHTTTSTLATHVLVMTTATAAVLDGFNSAALYVIKLSKFLLKPYFSLHTLPCNKKNRVSLMTSTRQRTTEH